jgi:CRP/FNR family transcriptional regulator, anaerobic regulatory protein
MNNNLHLVDGQESKGGTAAHSPISGASMADLLAAMGTVTGASSAAARIPMVVRRVRAGESLVHEGSPAKALYFVGAGTFKIFHTDMDGYERVLAIASRGEVLGYDALCMASHPTAIMALEDSSVFVVLRTELLELSQSLPAFTAALQRAGSQTLMRSRELADIMAAVASEVRLARFLILMSQRMMAGGQSPRRFRLRMGRRDIASLLGVAHETVSRSFSALSMARLLHVSDREIEILDMKGLEAFSRSTRRKTEDLYASTERARSGQRRRITRQESSSLSSLAA